MMVVDTSALWIASDTFIDPLLLLSSLLLMFMFTIVVVSSAPLSIGKVEVVVSL